MRAHYPLDVDFLAWLDGQLETRPPHALAQQLERLDEFWASRPTEPEAYLSDVYGPVLAAVARLLRVAQQHPHWFGPFTYPDEI